MQRCLYYVWKAHSREGETPVVCKHRVKTSFQGRTRCHLSPHCEFRSDRRETAVTPHSVPAYLGTVPGYGGYCTSYGIPESQFPFPGGILRMQHGKHCLNNSKLSSWAQVAAMRLHHSSTTVTQKKVLP